MGSTTGSTTNSNRLVDDAPFVSVTLSPMIVDPLRLVAGVRASPRLAPVPCKPRPAGGTRLGLDEVTLTLNSDAGVLPSATVNGINGVAVSSRVNWAGISPST